MPKLSYSLMTGNPGGELSLLRSDLLADINSNVRYRNNCWLGGDSLIDQAHMDANNLRRSAYNDLPLANAMSGNRAIFVINRATSGERSDQILQRFLADVASGAIAAAGIGTVIFNMGTNDIGLAPYLDVVSKTWITLAGAGANIVKNAITLIDTCISMGIQVMFQTIHGASNYSQAQIDQLEFANARFRAFRRHRLFLLEMRDLLRDPLTTTISTLAFRSGFLKQDAGPVYVHEAVPGAIPVAKRRATLLQAMMDPLPQHYADAAVEYSATRSFQRMMNPQFVVGGGGTAGVLGTGGTLGVNPVGGALTAVPDYWTCARISGDVASTWTVNVKEDSIGRYVELVVDNGAANGGVRLHQSIVSNNNWSYGETLQGFSTVEIANGAVNVACASPYLEINGTINSINATITAQGCGNDNAHGVFPGTEVYTLEDATEPVTIPTYESKGYVNFRAVHILFGAAGSGTFKVRFPRLDVSQPVPAMAA